MCGTKAAEYKFKIGDKVKVLKNDDGKDSDLDQSVVGKTGVVTRVLSYMGQWPYVVEIDGHEFDDSFGEDELQLYTPTVFSGGDRAILTKIENGFGEDQSEAYNLPMVVELRSEDTHPAYDFQAYAEDGRFVSAVKAKYLHPTDGKFPEPPETEEDEADENEDEDGTIEINGSTYALEDVMRRLETLEPLN